MKLKLIFVLVIILVLLTIVVSSSFVAVRWDTRDLCKTYGTGCIRVNSCRYQGLWIRAGSIDKRIVVGEICNPI
jgi:hypothetical protein